MFLKAIDIQTILLVICIFIAGVSLTSEAEPPNVWPKYWQLIPEQSDDFSGANLDTAKWQTSLWSPGATHADFKSSNVTVGNGAVSVWTKQEAYNGKQYTIGCFRSKFAVKSGAHSYFEYRVRAIDFRANTPSALWMHHHNDGAEIDLLETFSAATIWTTLHGWPPMIPSHIVYDYHAENVGPLDTKYHLYGVEIDSMANKLRFYFDSKMYWEYSAEHFRNNVYWHIVSLEAHDEWVPNPAFLPTSMDVDYIRTYSLSTENDTTSPVVTYSRSIGPNRIQVFFSHLMDSARLATVANYSIDNGAHISNAVAGDDGTSVVLFTTTLTAHQTYVLTINNLNDIVGNTISAGSTTSFTASESYSVLSCQLPVRTDSASLVAGEFAMKFISSQPGIISGIRYYKPAGETGIHTGRLATLGRRNLGTVTFANETASGWQQANFDTPIPISADTVYVVIVNANTIYSSTRLQTSLSVTSGELSTNVGSANGVWGMREMFPYQAYPPANYFRDVVFTPGNVKVGPGIYRKSILDKTSHSGAVYSIYGKYLGRIADLSVLRNNKKGNGVSIIVPDEHRNGQKIVSVRPSFVNR